MWETSELAENISLLCLPIFIVSQEAPCHFHTSNFLLVYPVPLPQCRMAVLLVPHQNDVQKSTSQKIKTQKKNLNNNKSPQFVLIELYALTGNLLFRGTKAIFRLQRNPSEVFSFDLALPSPIPTAILVSCFSRFNNILTKFSFVWEEKFGFCVIFIHTLVLPIANRLNTHISLAESSSCLDFHPNMWIKTAGKTSTVSPTFYGLTNSLHPADARS